MTACVNEPIDRGAAYSTFGLVRAGGASDGAHSMSSALPDPAADPHVTPLHLARQDYHWGSQVDGIGLVQVRQLLEQGMPDLLWWNTTLTDAGHHAGGPRSEVARSALRDADRRLGAFLDDLASRDLLDGTVFLLTADHGSEPADPECVGDWDVALQEAGIPFRDEGYGFIYLGG
jgi:predicted AlkP superfamily pyrophosphatase or phosphodiesterase